MKTQPSASWSAANMLTTETLSNALAMRPQSIRKRLCQTGEYYGIRPTKLPNGRLLWPADSLQQLVASGSK